MIVRLVSCHERPPYSECIFGKGLTKNQGADTPRLPLGNGERRLFIRQLGDADLAEEGFGVPEDVEFEILAGLDFGIAQNVI